MKECKECGVFIESGEYCMDCGIKRALIEPKHLNSRKNKNGLGNPKQDKEILKFLREKRKRENKKYLNNNN
jgi:hypothetical protein